jgi:hypothetical protein
MLAQMGACVIYAGRHKLYKPHDLKHMITSLPLDGIVYRRPERPI